MHLDQHHLQQTPPDVLSDLGLVHEYPVHIDILNNEEGFALYVETPHLITDEEWTPLFSRESEHLYVSLDVYELLGPEGLVLSNLRPADIYDNAYLRIREVDDAGDPGGWHVMRVDANHFAQNADTPGALEALGFDRFDSVTWFEGLEADKQYQVQFYFDRDNDGGHFDGQGHWVRGTNATVLADGTREEEPGDWYYWQEPDLYSGIHTLNTDPDAFNIDIDADGAMDYFIA